MTLKRRIDRLERGARPSILQCDRNTHTRLGGYSARRAYISARMAQQFTSEDR